LKVGHPEREGFAKEDLQHWDAGEESYMANRLAMAKIQAIRGS
jgi:hypothetical protein